MRAPRLTSVKGKKVAFTGRLTDARRYYEARVRSARGRPVGEVSSETDIVVQGSPSPSYKWGDIGVKLDRVETERARGHLIYVISGHELEGLLAGRPLSYAASAARRSGRHISGRCRAPTPRPSRIRRRPQDARG